MANKYDIGKRSEIDRLFKDIQESIKEQAEEIIANKAFDVTCPHCKNKISVKPGKSLCPVCQKEIRLTIKTE